MTYFMQVTHQAETIKQLRREAQQWREQFLRVDEERTRLSARVDELVLDQVSVSRCNTARLALRFTE